MPVDRTHPFVPFDELVSELRGTMLADDHLDKELRELDAAPRDPFAYQLPLITRDHDFADIDDIDTVIV